MSARDSGPVSLLGSADGSPHRASRSRLVSLPCGGRDAHRLDAFLQMPICSILVKARLASWSFLGGKRRNLACRRACCGDMVMDAVFGLGSWQLMQLWLEDVSELVEEGAVLVRRDGAYSPVESGRERQVPVSSRRFRPTSARSPLCARKSVPRRGNLMSVMTKGQSYLRPGWIFCRSQFCSSKGGAFRGLDFCHRVVLLKSL